MICPNISFSFLINKQKKHVWDAQQTGASDPPAHLTHAIAYWRQSFFCMMLMSLGMAHKHNDVHKRNLICISFCHDCSALTQERPYVVAFLR